MSAERRKDPRDVLADRITQWAGEASVYNYVDRLLADLDTAGWSLVESDPGDELLADHDVAPMPRIWEADR